MKPGKRWLLDKEGAALEGAGSRRPVAAFAVAGEVPH